jgi:hypothetical protein
MQAKCFLAIVSWDNGGRRQWHAVVEYIHPHTTQGLPPLVDSSCLECEGLLMAESNTVAFCHHYCHELFLKGWIGRKGLASACALCPLPEYVPLILEWSLEDIQQSLVELWR